MISGYTRPQEIIQQILDNTPNGAEPRTLHAFTCGPQYDLFRYTNATERAAKVGVAFVENTSTDPDDRQLVPYEGLLPTHVVDTGYAKLYGENLEGQLWLNASSGSEAGDYRVRLVSLAHPNKLRVTNTGGDGVNVGLAGGDLIAPLHGSPISFGDIMYAYLGSAVTRRTITAVEREVVASHTGSNVAADDLLFAAGTNNPVLSGAAVFSNESAPSGWTLSEDNAATAWSGLVEGSRYNGKYAEKYTITITRSSVNGVGGKARIRSASGAFSADNVTVTAVGDDYTVTNAALGGVHVRFTPTVPYADLTVGDTFSFVVTGKYKPLALSGTKDLVLTGSYAGPVDTQYIVTVVSGVSVGAVNDSFTGSKIRVSDTAGTDVNQEYTIAHGVEYALGTFGLRFSFPTAVTTPSLTHQLGLRTGDVYFVNAVSAKATGPASVIVLSGQAADTTDWIDSDVEDNLFDVDVRTLFTGSLDAKRNTPPDLAWVAGATGLTVTEELSLFIANRTSNPWVPVKDSAKGRLFSHWRGFVPALVDEPISRYFSETAILNKFGSNDPDNPLCYGSIIAMRGAQGKSIWVGRLRVPGIDGYTALLKQASRIDGIYSVAPVEASPAITALFKQHVDDVSTQTEKLWRRVYLGSTNPGPYSVLTVDINGDALQAEVQGNSNGNVRVVAPAALFLTEKIQPGDLFRTFFVSDDWGIATSTDYTVQSVADETELFLVSGPNAPVSPAIRFEIWRPDSGPSQAQYVGNLAEAIQDRRVVTAWTDNPLRAADAAGTLLPTLTVFEACEIAGLRSALLPQQGLTYTELKHSLASAPRMFTKYTSDDLDLAASHGVMIVTQDLDGGPIYIRHQLTTKTDVNSLYYEDSVGTNLDAIAYAFKDLFASYIGKRNVNPQTVAEIYVRSQGLLDSFKAPPVAAPNVGPQIIDALNLSVGIDPVFKDRINLSVTLALPLPLNTLFIKLTGTTTNVATTISVQTLQGN